MNEGEKLGTHIWMNLIQFHPPFFRNRTSTHCIYHALVSVNLILSHIPVMKGKSNVK